LLALAGIPLRYKRLLKARDYETDVESLAVFRQSNSVVLGNNANVGIGVSAPNENLEIGGDGRAFFGDGQGATRQGLLIDGIQGTGSRIEAYDYATSTGTTLYINTTGDGPTVIGGTLAVETVNFGDYANLQYNTSTKVFYYDNSSRRFKENIHPLYDDFDAILEATPVQYTRPGAPERVEVA